MGLSDSLVEKLRSLVFRLGHYFGLTTTDCDEAFSDALVRLLKNHHKIKGNPNNYLYRMARSVVIDFKRTHKKYLWETVYGFLGQMQNDGGINEVFIRVYLCQFLDSLGDSSSILTKVAQGEKITKRERSYIRARRPWLQEKARQALLVPTNSEL